MEATELQPVRWFRLSLEHGEDMKKNLLEWARENRVALAWVQCLGEVENATVASGYDTADGQPVIQKQRLDANRHVMGFGTIERTPGKEEVHLHGPMGRTGETVSGCWAERPSVFRGMDCLVAVFERS